MAVEIALRHGPATVCRRAEGSRCRRCGRRYPWAMEVTQRTFPSQERLEQASWFNALAEQDRQMVRTLVGDAARATLFGVLCILDGSRPIEPSDAAHFELARIESDRSILLASSDFAAAPLH